MKNQIYKFITLGFMGATLLVACNSNNNRGDENTDTVSNLNDYPATNETTRPTNGLDTVDTTSTDTLGTGFREQ
ncbi:hypothetical protein EIM50_21900 [Pseudoxanthomonas sp. SGD-10]|nr:hypothetical protein EIM50_21900 [Pseudoxanthomonas sp. SGD-10]